MNEDDSTPVTGSGVVAIAAAAGLADVERYYSGKIAMHGATPVGVDWNGPDSQELRFVQLLKLCDAATPCSINDLGCGYGQLYSYLLREQFDCDYLGTDISGPMIEAAKELHAGSGRARFVQGILPERVADFSLASGIFNVRQQTPDETWRAWIWRMLELLDASSSRGFAFNCLTKYSDRERMRVNLYYADPLQLFDHCKSKFSRNVALLHDYGLFEFTILVRKML